MLALLFQGCDTEAPAAPTCDASAWYDDADGDGAGDLEAVEEACEAPAGFIADSSDCDDADPDVHPGATGEWCDFEDDDCDGLDACGRVDGERVGAELVPDPAAGYARSEVSALATGELLVAQDHAYHAGPYSTYVLRGPAYDGRLFTDAVRELPIAQAGPWGDKGAIVGHVVLSEAYVHLAGYPASEEGDEPTLEYMATAVTQGSDEPATGDFTGDGIADIAFWVRIQDEAAYHEEVRVIDGSRTGLIGQGEEAAVIAADSGEPYRFFAGVAVGDTDGDGIGDLLLPGTGGQPSLLFRGALAGSLSERDFDVEYPGTGYHSGAAGDVDHDGRDDFLLMAWEEDVGSTGICLFSGVEDGTYGCEGASTVFETAVDGEGIGGPFLGGFDLDGDGAADFAASTGTDHSAGGWVVLGPFGPTVTRPDDGFDLGFQADDWDDLAAPDLDADGRSDLAIATSGNHFVSVVTGTTLANYAELLGAR